MPSRGYRLKTKESPIDGARRVARGRTEKALERLDGVGDDELASAIHGARKDLKKLRALLRLVREELGPELVKAENRRYRDAARLLSSSRDAQVKLETLIALRKAAGDELLAAETALWESELEAERDEAAARLGAESAGRIDDARQAIAAGHEQIAEWPLEREDWKLVGPGLRRSYRNGKQEMKQVRKEPSAEAVHAWRKRVKDLWYQLRLIEEAWPAQLKATAGQAHELAELLGNHHDLAVLAEDLGSRWGVSGKASFEAAIERRQDELLATALALGARLYAERPKALSGRIEAYWLAWRGR
ncbi:MAG TPA: CHAD domain-containing protein [Solirubrobacterales bacterium]|nr:CHAD domain-containing protein [Solirubrobacterales bacterium]